MTFVRAETVFALQDEVITSRPLDVARIALPLLVYFAAMWIGSYAIGKVSGLNYERTMMLVFTAAGNNFELACGVSELCSHALSCGDLVLSS